MIIWRIANKAHNTLNGLGGMFVGGRWHTKGRQIVYTAEHPALSAMEILVHMDMDIQDLPDFVLLKIQIPYEQDIIDFEIDASDAALCRQTGDQWLELNEHAVARVPSVVTPDSYNYLINPTHADAALIEIVSEVPLVFDGRLLGGDK
jgi:RES domain-containing protein